MHEVVALALELGVRRDRDRDVQVAGDAAAGAAGPRSGRRSRWPLVDPGRDLDVDAPERLHPPLAPAVAARREDAAPGGVAGGARRRRDHLAEDRAPYLAYLARAPAHVATGRVRAGLAPGSVAALARDGQPDLHRVDDAEGGFAEGELDRDLGVEAPRRSRRPPPAAEGVAVEEGVEQVAEPEGVAGLAGAGTGTGCALRSEHVVPAAPLGVAQRLVRDRELLELGLGVGVVGFRVRVVPPRERADTRA